MKSAVVLTGLMMIGSVVSAQPSIRLRARNARALQTDKVTRGGSHYILVFNSTPTPATHSDLAARGIRVLQFVPDTGLMVTMPPSANLDGLDLAYTTALEAGDKLSPALQNSSSNYFLVIFHSDVESAKTREIALNTGFDVLDNASLLPNQMVAAGSFHRLNTLAENDEVAYIMPASPELVSGAPVVACPGAVTEGGAIGEYSVAGNGWSKDSKGAVALKYIIQNLTQKMDSNVARGEIERAVREWTKYANLSFTMGERADSARTIAIRFAAGAHGDGYAFDGPRKVSGAHVLSQPGDERADRGRPAPGCG
jgi:hypothetical protein